MTTLVFDASVATKWFKDHEADSEQAMAYLGDPDSHVWLPDNCAHEVVNGVHRRLGAGAAARAWIQMGEAGVTVAYADNALVTEALIVAEDLGCDYYDALAPALARLVGGTLVSADRKAHGAYPGVVLLG